MIELDGHTLKFSFPGVHPQAKLHLEFQRTLRIPDDGQTYPLPPGLGCFPLRLVDDYRVPAAWQKRGGVMLPMYQAEALWINFNPTYIPEHHTTYPFAIKVAAGKINALTGRHWAEKLHDTPQDYMVSTKQPWLDGYSVAKGLIRQFVAMPLGAGYSAEEQLGGRAEHGGLQIVVYPMRAAEFTKRYPLRLRRAGDTVEESICFMESDMALAPGGKMKQEIYADPYHFGDWDQDTGSRCFVHLANSLVWRAITGEEPPSPPLTAREYNDYGLPWFDYYDENSTALAGSTTLAQLKSVIEKAADKGDNPLPENETTRPAIIKKLGSGKTIRQGEI